MVERGLTCIPMISSLLWLTCITATPSQRALSSCGLGLTSPRIQFCINCNTFSWILHSVNAIPMDLKSISMSSVLTRLQHLMKHTPMSSGQTRRKSTIKTSSQRKWVLVVLKKHPHVFSSDPLEEHHKDNFTAYINSIGFEIHPHEFSSDPSEVHHTLNFAS